MGDPTPKAGDSDRDDSEAPGRLGGLQATVRNLDSVSKSVFASASWRWGQRIANLLRRFGMRLPASGAEAETARLIQELEKIADLASANNASRPDDIVLGKRFQVSLSAPRRFPVSPPKRPLDWELKPETLPELEAELSNLKHRPLISVVVPVYNTKREWLEPLISSVKKQFYPDWELVLVDDGSTRSETTRCLHIAESESRTQVIRRPNSGGISAATNTGVEAASGEFIAFADHDDLLEPDALLQVVRAIDRTNADIVYTDEDKITEEGDKFYDQHHKPAWSPDFILVGNYVSHLSVIRKALVYRVGGLRSEFDGSQDHDLLLRCSELTHNIVHVPMVLYRWRAVEGSTAKEFSGKSFAWDAGRSAVADAMSRRNIPATVKKGTWPGTYSITRKLSGEDVVSILIPFKDQPKLLRSCITSILERSKYENFEILGIDNQSVKEETRSVIKDLERSDPRVRFLKFDKPFNFSAINNFAVGHAKGGHVLLLNNDTEVVESCWIEALLAHSVRMEVGAVGGKLLYPDRSIQHAGVLLGIGGVANHSHLGLPENSPGYFARPHLTQNVSAVTGACLMVKKGLYEAAGGLDVENLAVAFNDIDLCLRLRERNLLNVYEPAAVLFHHESKSRGYEDSAEKQARFASEVDYMRRRHSLALLEVDPYFNPNFEQHTTGFILR